MPRSFNTDRVDFHHGSAINHGCGKRHVDACTPLNYPVQRRIGPVLISTRSRYGLKIMYELAFRYGAQPVFLKDIANAHSISEKYLSKLVIPLRGVGLISSFRGAHGGYALARDPRKITVREIVQVLEGEIAPAAGTRKADHDQPSAVHPTENVWALLDKTVYETLESVTLDSLVQAGRNEVLNYQI
jgi:Rrf2 family cysteine metabolism transcriptional repressor